MRQNVVGKHHTNGPCQQKSYNVYSTKKKRGFASRVDGAREDETSRQGKGNDHAGEIRQSDCKREAYEPTIENATKKVHGRRDTTSDQECSKLP